LTANFSQIYAGFSTVKRYAAALVDALLPSAVDARALRAARAASAPAAAHAIDDDAHAARRAHRAACGRSTGRTRAERVENRGRVAGVRSGAENPVDGLGGTKTMRIDESIRGITPFR